MAKKSLWTIASIPTGTSTGQTGTLLVTSKLPAGVGATIDTRFVLVQILSVINVATGIYKVLGQAGGGGGHSPARKCRMTAKSHTRLSFQNTKRPCVKAQLPPPRHALAHTRKPLSHILP